MRVLPICVALALAALLAPSAGAAPANYRAVSQDGEVILFTTTEQLVPGDTDTKQDVYQRVYDSGLGQYVTREVSIGPVGGNDAYEAFFERISADGKRVFFSTFEPLVSTDTDGRRDVYVRDLEAGTTEIVSKGDPSCSPCGNGAIDSDFAGSTGDGASVFFVTSESLVPADQDTSFDIYQRDLTAGTTKLVSAAASSCPACGNGPFTPAFWGVSANGAEAYFTTAEKLSSADEDSTDDIYARDLATGSTVLVSVGDCPGCGNSGAVPVFRGSSASGSRGFFVTDEAIAAGDGDTATDVYARDLPSGPTVLVSAGTALNVTAGFAAASSDGATVFFTTTEGLSGADTNNATDVYRWTGGAPTLITSGTCTQGSGCGSSFNNATADGSSIMFTTTEKLGAGDTDTSADIYAAAAPGWAPTLVSAGESACLPACGNGPEPAILNAATANATKAFFTTAEGLSTQDTDAGADIYLRNLTTASTSLASPSGVCPHPGACNTVFSGASSDGAHVVFQTDERLTAEDVDSESDIYERSNGETRIVSAGNAATIGPATPVLTGTDPASPGESLTPSIKGQADPETSIKLYTSSDCSGVPVATGTSTELGSAGLAVTVAAGSTTSFRATATDLNGDTSPCSLALSYTQATPEVPPPPPPPSEPPPPSGGESSDGGKTGSGIRTGGGGKGGGGSIAYVAPQTLITFGPGSKTRKQRPVFRFVDVTEQPGTEFFCKVDRQRWRGCSSPKKLSRLAPGSHVFQVKSVNAVGVWAATPVKRKFKVVK
jgi:Tol biopolymer transport system component